MPWYAPWSESIKKRACRYLLQRYLGQFLERKLGLEQLEVDLYGGTGAVTGLHLDVQALNELGETQGWPLEFVDGFIQQMNVSIPWATILKDDSFIQVNGLSVTIQPKQRSENVTSMFESMWSSMTSSMQLAAECLKQEGENVAAPQPVEGIELFAQTIDSILSRVKVRFSNTTIRIEHVPIDSKTGVALEIHIKNIDYLDEAGSDPPSELLESEKNKSYVVSTFTTKRIAFEGVTFHTDEFPSAARTFARSVIEPKCASNDESSDACHETSSDESKLNKPETEFSSDNTLRDLTKVNSAPGPILFGKLAGKQEIRLKMKQSEEAVGPKVDFQLTLGSLTLFLTPRQFHVLYELANGLSSPHLEDNSNVPIRNLACMESKPMQKHDFERVEAQLTGELMSERGLSSMIKKHGWSTANIDDSDQENEKFLPLASRHDNNLMSDSFASTGSLSSSITSNTSSLGSTVLSNKGGSPYNSRRKKGIPQVDGDPGAEVSQIHVRIASFTCILLHEDILTLSASLGGDSLSVNSVDSMKKEAENFFTKLDLFISSGSGSNDFDSVSEGFNDVVTYNHLRLNVAPLVLEGNEKTNSQGVNVSGHLTMTRVDFRECLYSPDPCDPTKIKLQVVNLLSFKPAKNTQTENDMTCPNIGKHVSTTPNIKVAFVRTQKAVRISGEKRYAYPRTEISLNFEPCTVEIDISIVDRMCAILNSQPICKTNNNKSSAFFSKQAFVSDKNLSLSDYFTETKFICSLLNVKLRFPVVDLRPVHDMSRLPWWQRAVRQDLLLATLQGATIMNTCSHSQLSTEVKIQCRQFDLYYLENENDSEIHIGRACAEESNVNLSNPNLPTVGWPTVIINILPSHQPKGALLDSSSDGELSEPFNKSRSDTGHRSSSKYQMGQSTAMLMDKLNTSNSSNSDRPGPFSSKKMVHESDTPHSKDSEENPEELVIPGDAAELGEFVDYSIRNSYIQIKCDLPIVSLQLNSKRLYEVLYNRINSDLFLWEPSAPKMHYQPKISGTFEPDVFGVANMQDSIHPIFSMCKSGINYNSDSDSSSSSDNVYYSVYDQKKSMKMKSLQKSSNKSSKSEKMSNICFNLKIGKGQLTMYTPVRDSSNLVLPVQQGELVIKAKEVTLCHAGGIGGNSRSGLLSLQAADVQLHHCGRIPIPTEKMPLRMYGCSLPSHLKCIIYSSDKGVMLKPRGHNGYKDILNIAVSIKPNKEFVGLKNIKVAVGIANATLHHIMTASSHTWLNQIMDMFDVLDYPIPGYVPSTVITELHVHLWDCAIDYRPIHLPISTVITLGSFSISSNVVAKTNTSNLRFIAEECALFLSEELKTNSIDLKKDFICVVDLGLFELSLRLSEKNITTVPRVDLRASNNIIHVRTCADSFKALCKLINYLASDGDFNDPENADSTGSDSGSISHSNLTDRDSSSPFKENVLIGVSDRQQEEIRDLSVSQVQRVNEMMADAMQENTEFEDAENDECENAVGEGVEVFFFPDESGIPKAQRDSSPAPKSSKNSSTSDLPNMSYQECYIETKKEFKPEHFDDGPSGSNSRANKSLDDLPPTAVVAKELGDFSNHFGEMKINPTAKACSKSSAENTDDEFCILGEDIVNASKKVFVEPELKWFITEPLNIVENHFAVPVGKTDLLKPPKNFPMAVLRYTLCEMTLVWHIYGGNDFSSSNKANDPDNSGRSHSLGPTKKNVTINETNRQSPTFSHRMPDRDPYNVLPSGSQMPYNTQRTAHHPGGISFNKANESVSHVYKKAPSSPRELPWRHRGGPGRRHDILIELQLNKIRFQHETYPADGVEASRQVLLISSVEVRDRLATSLFNKFLHLHSADARMKRKHANMVVIKAVHIRPDPKLTAQECCLKVSLLPLRFNIDQDALLFLIGFFSSLGEGDSIKDDGISSAHSGSNQSLHSAGGSSRHSTPTHQPPIMTVNTPGQSTSKASSTSPRRPSSAYKTNFESDNVMISSDCVSEDSMSVRDEDHYSDNTLMDSYEAERLVSENLILLEEDMKLNNRRRSSSSGKSETASFKGRVTIPNDTVDDAPIYFRSVVFSPEVPIRLDYQGKRVDLTHGPLAGLLMGLGQLDCSELHLKPLTYRHGILGVDRLFKWAFQEWLSDIKRRQLHGLLGGVGPMHSLVQLFQGIRDLFWLPIEQYQRDGRIIRGLQRGASSFTTSTAMAALDITARIIHLIQATAETAYDMVSPSPGLRGTRGKGKRRRDRPRQPQDIREGVTNAYHLVKDGIGETAQALADVATKEHAARGYSGAVGGVLRQLPPTVLAPVLLASAAAGRVIGGVRATIAPADLRDHRDKWRGPIDQLDTNEHSLEVDTYSDD